MKQLWELNFTNKVKVITKKYFKKMVRNITLTYCLLVFLLTPSQQGFSQNLGADQIYDKFKDALVVIYSYGFDGNVISQGSGVIINDSGHVVTNYHNFQHAEKIAVKYMGKIYEGNEIIGADIIRDILILKLKGRNFHSVKRANIKNIKVGQKIYALGTPIGLENTLSEGIISGIRYDAKQNRNLIQFTASITHGSSGGALLNEAGELLGITSYGFDKANLNFAIPINELDNIDIIPYKKGKDLTLINLYYRGINAFSANYYDKAIEYFKNYLNNDSNYYPIYYQIGLAYEKLEKLDSAIIYFQLTIKKNSRFAMSYGQLGYVNLLLGYYNEAEIFLKKAIKLDHKLASAYNNLGALYVYKKEYDKTILYCEQAIKINPYYEEAYGNIAVAHGRLKEFDLAIDMVKRALKYNPDSDLGYYNLGSFYSKKLDYYKAVECYLNAIKINPNFISAHVDLGSTYLSLEEYDNAIQQFTRVLYFYNKNILPKKNFKPNEIYRTYSGLGYANYNKKNFEKAIQYYEEGVKVDTNATTIYIELARTYNVLKDSTKELFYIIKAVNQDTSYWKYYAIIGNSYLRQNKYELAIENYRKYVNHDNKNNEILYKLSLAYYNTNQSDSSKNILESLIENDSTDAEAYNFLGVISTRNHNFEDGIKFFLRAIGFGSKKAGCYYNIGAAYLSMGKGEDAIYYFKESARLGYEPALKWLKENKIDFKL